MGGPHLRPLGIVLFTARVACGQGGTADRVDQFVGSEMERQKVPGVAVGVVKNGEPVLVKGYGYANLEHQVRVSPETIFSIASLTKQFTAAAVMLLVQDGRLSLDRSITPYLRGAPEQWGPITVRHLLTHTSGIPDYTPEPRRDYTQDEFAKLAFSIRSNSEPAHAGTTATRTT
jgi:CubicO group peptidase (beta-lactamase class C family)